MGFDLRFGRPVNIEQRGLVTESLSTPTQRIDFPRAADLPNLYIECTAASSIYGPPYLQSQTDMQSCILHAKGKDYSTVSSSFFEAFKNLSAAGMKDSSAAGGKVQDKEEKARAKEVGGDTKNEQG
uniref:Uncharacterized protein n=1 Tax=Psilocybe cubensis TaxID=181762 RepID=A0A8H7Y9H8_PSICU